MTEKVLAQGEGLGALEEAAGNIDTQVRKGDVVTIRMRLLLIPPGTVGAVQAALEQARVPLVQPVFTEPGRVLVIRFKRNPAPLLVIAVIAAVVFLGTLLTGWSIGVSGGGGITTMLLVGAGVILLANSKLGQDLLKGRRR